MAGVYVEPMPGPVSLSNVMSPNRIRVDALSSAPFGACENVHLLAGMFTVWLFGGAHPVQVGVPPYGAAVWNE